MIGLGVGIDYALFIVTRHFRGLDDGLEIRESIARAAATSGGAVVFAGSTVTIALVSLAVANIPLVTTMGFMAAIAVVVAVLAAVTLLPAMLAIVGPHINSLRVRGRHHARRNRSRACGLGGRTSVARHRSCRDSCPGDPHSARDSAAVAESRPEGRRGAVFLDHGSPCLRSDRAELRSRCQRPADRRRVARVAGEWNERLPSDYAPAGRLACLGRRRGHPDSDRQGRHHRVLQRDLQVRSGRHEDRRSSRHPSLERHPERREGHQHEGLRGRHDGRLRRPGVEHLEQAAAPDPGRDRPQLPAAGPRVPHTRCPGSGCAHEPALDRRLLWCAHRALPVRMAPQPDRS